MSSRSREPWNLPDELVTPEAVWLDRRRLIQAMGLSTVALAAGCAPGEVPHRASPYALPPVARDTRYPALRPVTLAKHASAYNNFYEFSTDKRAVATLAADMQTRPWKLVVDGLVEEPRTFDIESLLSSMPLEERVYRFRCVESWSMVVPWSGLPLSALLSEVRPTSEARYVRFVTVDRPASFPGVASSPTAPWPYSEALRLDEAMSPLTLLAVGIYGKALPNQHGAPIRLVVPWKYGYKSIKSIARIELTAQEPSTFWNTRQPDEYDWLANVDPELPHPRWSQATERMLPGGERIPTLPLNGYGKWVGKLYGA